MNLRGWLRKTPPAHSVRCSTEEGPKLVKINHQDERKWARAEETILQLGATLVEALDKAGDVLRAVQLEAPPDLDGGAKEEEKAPNTELAQLARLLVTAQKQGAEFHESAYKRAFDMLHDLVKSTVEANNKNVTLVNQLLRRLAQAEAEAAGSGGAGVEDVPSMLMHMVMGGGPKANGANGHANGGGPGPADMEAAFRKAVAEAVAEEMNKRPSADDE